MNNLEDLISGLDLEPHPEGGFFRETYRSKGEIPKENLADSYSGNRNYSTCIYFLLTASALAVLGLALALPLLACF
jgi:predicted cupin superfamily sugar epimerase